MLNEASIQHPHTQLKCCSYILIQVKSIEVGQQTETHKYISQSVLNTYFKIRIWAKAWNVWKSENVANFQLKFGYNWLKVTYRLYYEWSEWYQHNAHIYNGSVDGNMSLHPQEHLSCLWHRGLWSRFYMKTRGECFITYFHNKYVASTQMCFIAWLFKLLLLLRCWSIVNRWFWWIIRGPITLSVLVSDASEPILESLSKTVAQPDDPVSSRCIMVLSVSHHVHFILRLTLPALWVHVMLKLLYTVAVGGMTHH